MLDHRLVHSPGRAALTVAMGLLSATVAALFLIMLWLNPILLAALGPLALLSATTSAGLFAIHLWRSDGRRAHIVAAAALCVVDLGLTIGSPFFLTAKGTAYLIAVVTGARMLQRSGSGKLSLGVLFLVYSALAWLTVLISPDPFANAHTGLALVGVAFAAVIIERLPYDSALKVSGAIAIVIGIGCAISLALYIVLPGLVIAHNVAGGGRTGGVFGSPNSFGAVAAVGVLLGLVAVAKQQARVGPRWAVIHTSIASLGGLALSGSRTAAISLILALAIAGIALRPRGSLALMLLVGTVVFIIDLFDFLSPILDVARRLLSRDRSGADLQTLTGRLAIWEFAFDAWLREPWFGYGLGQSRQLISEGWANRWGGTTGSAHNLLLESLLNVGLIGTGALAGLVGACVFRLIRLLCLKKSENLLPMLYIATSLLAFALLQGFTEKSFGGTASMATSALALAIGYLGRRLPLSHESPAKS